MRLQLPRRRLGDLLRQDRPQLTLDHFGFDPASLQCLRDALDELARELHAVLNLQSSGGDVVLIDEHVPHTVPAPVLQAICEGRPCITVARGRPRAGMARGAIAAQALRQALLAQIDATPRGGRDAMATRTRPPAANALPASGFASGFDSGLDSGLDSRSPSTPCLADQPLDHGRRQLLHGLRRAWLHADETELGLSYGPGRSMLLDFDQGLAWVEVEALHCLRVQRELPHPAPAGRLVGGRLVRELELTLWDLATAAGPFELLDAPAHWWHTDLRPLRLEDVSRYSNLPLHLELARTMAGGGMTPSRLRRECRTSIAEIRCFLQACLFLGLVQWGSAPDAPPAVAAGASPGVVG